MNAPANRLPVGTPGVGIVSAVLRVRLTGSENGHLSYPCDGLLDIHETGRDGSIINATFRPDSGGSFVAVKHPNFTVRPS